MSSPVIMEFKVGDAVYIKCLPEYRYGLDAYQRSKLAPVRWDVVDVDDGTLGRESYRLRCQDGTTPALWFAPHEVEKVVPREAAFKELPVCTVFHTRTGGVFLKLLEENGYNAACISPADMPHTFLEGQLAFFYSGASVFLDPIS